VRSQVSVPLHSDYKNPNLGGRHLKRAELTLTSSETIYSNARVQGGRPVLSIASPYFRDDPTAWLEALSTDPRAKHVEIILVDDGSGDTGLDAKVRSAIDAWQGPATLVRFHANQGRASARNRAIAAAKGEYLLFIDADMLPGDTQFLARYFDLINKRAAAIIFGGFMSGDTQINHDTLLNYALAQKNDCKLASERAKRGAIAVASNNLLVRRDVFEHIPFDSKFTGWGWEDTEWAMRAVFAGYGLIHVDNPAIHVGLDSTLAMLRKYKEAGPNLRRLLDRHPEAGMMTGAKIAKLLRHFPGHSLMRPISSWVARDPVGIVPVVLRGLALKYWRASHAAQALTD
jgi:glycosyltransferase involved in cell wall biosynthesis